MYGIQETIPMGRNWDHIDTINNNLLIRFAISAKAGKLILLDSFPVILSFFPLTYYVYAKVVSFLSNYLVQ